MKILHQTMGAKKRIKFNIDKKRQCYLQPQGLFDEIKQYRQGDFICYDNFKLHVIDDGRSGGSDKEPVKIKANVIVSSSVLGEFSFNDSAKYDGKCFFEFSNSALYLVSGYNREGKCNYQSFLPYVAAELGLILNNHTEVEVACDINFNPLPYILKLVKDCEKFDMFKNGKKVKDADRILDGYIECYERSRKQRRKYPTIYLHQIKNNSPSLKIYDKRKEIQEHSPYKQYIEEWNEFKGRNMYRLEVSLKNEDFRQWQQYVDGLGVFAEWGSLGDSEGLLQTEEYKCALWNYISNRLIYFVDKRTGKTVTLLDVVKGMVECI